MVEPAGVAVHGVELTPIALNDTAVVMGAGMIGIFTIQALKAAGCGKIIAVDLEDDKLDLALTLGRLGWTFHYEPAASASHVRSYGSAPRLANRRGRFRTSTLANRQRNIIRHAPGFWWLRSAFALVQDAGFAGLRLIRGDVRAPVDVGRAWAQVARNVRNDRAKRGRLADPRWLSRVESAT